MKYFLVILYLTNPCSDASLVKVKEYASYFDCEKQRNMETKVKDSKFPFKTIYCVGSTS